MNRTVVLQSNYIPWRGYFHLMREADTFVFHDDLQYTHSDWRNRNKIITPSGTQWLSIPAGRDEKRMICDVEVPDQSWKSRHLRALESNYRKAPHFEHCSALLPFLYDNEITNLSDFNQRAIRRLADLLGISPVFYDSRELGASGQKSERLIQLLKKIKATHYLSGPAGAQYLDDALFREANIKLEYFEYPAYPDYPQLFGQREYNVSVLDLLFNVGPEAPAYIWG